MHSKRLGSRLIHKEIKLQKAMNGMDTILCKTDLRVYSDRTRQRQNDGVKHNALDLEHMLVNRSIQTGRVASKNLYNRIDPNSYSETHI